MIIDDSMKIFLVAIGVKQFTTKKAKAGTVYKAQVLARSKFAYRFTQEWWKKFHENNALFFDHEAEVVAFHKAFREDGTYFVDFEQRTLGVYFVPAHEATEAKAAFKAYAKDWEKGREMLTELGFIEDPELQIQKPSNYRILFSYEVKPFLRKGATTQDYLKSRVVIPVPAKMGYKAAWDEFVDMAREEQKNAAGRD